MTTKKRGPKPTGRALTPNQRLKRHRAKQASLVNAADNAGFKPYNVLISDKQLKSLSKFMHVETGATTLEPNKLNEVVYYALKGYLDNLKQDFLERGHSLDVVEACAYLDDLTDYNNLMQVEMTAAKLFKAWEKQQ